MSTTTTTHAQAGTARPHNHANTLLAAAQVLLAAVFAFAAVPKLAGAHSATVMFSQIGAGQWLRYLVGTAELAGAIGLLIPRLAGLAAAGLAADMAGATIINIAVLHSAAVVMTIPLGAAFALLAWYRREQTRSLGAAVRQQRQSPRQVTRPAGRQESSLTGQETTQ
jgi:putative oxidoreductase